MDKLQLFFAIVLPIAMAQNSANSSQEIQLVEFLRQRCHLDPDANSPNELSGYPTKMFIDMSPLWLIGIDDVSEVFSLGMHLMLLWSVPCVNKEMAKNPKFSRLANNSYFYFRDNSIWTPRVLHWNSLTGTSLYSDDFERSLRYSQKFLSFEHLFLGSVHSRCDLDLWLFPFDQQTCYIGLTVDPPEPYSSFGEPIFKPTSKWIPQNSNWEFVNSTSISTYRQFDGHHYIYFYFTLQRKSNYFTMNLFCPGILLTILLMTSFFIAPDSADRTSYAATIMLALFVVHAQILSYLPKSPNPILAANYVIGEICFGTSCTVYAAFICWLINSSKFIRKKVKFCLFSIQLFKIIDAIVCLLFLLAIFFLNFTAASLAGLI